MGPSKLSVNPVCAFAKNALSTSTYHGKPPRPQIFEISPLEPRYSEWLVFEGISVDETGKQRYAFSPHA